MLTQSACPPSSDLHCFYFSDYLFKLLLIGDSGVGKSCLLLRFAVSSSLSPSKTCFPITVNILMSLLQLKCLVFPHPVLLYFICAICVGWHLHRELHQHHWSGLQDPHHWTGWQDHQTANCEFTDKHTRILDSIFIKTHESLAVCVRACSCVCIGGRVRKLASCNWILFWLMVETVPLQRHLLCRYSSASYAHTQN